MRHRQAHEQNTSYDSFIAGVLRRVQPEFAFITPDYAFDRPAEITWTLVKALVAEQGLSTRHAAEVVLDLCIRRGQAIPRLINSQPRVELPSQLDFRQ